MENTVSDKPYIVWLIIIILTIYFFNLFVKKYKDSLIKLLAIVLSIVWILISIISIFINFYSNVPVYTISLIGITGSLAFHLPVTILIGGITFSIKYIKRKNRL